MPGVDRSSVNTSRRFMAGTLTRHFGEFNPSTLSALDGHRNTREPASRRDRRLRPGGLLRRRAPAERNPDGSGREAEQSAAVSYRRHVRPPADAVRAGARRRRARPPEDQVGDPHVREDRRRARASSSSATSTSAPTSPSPSSRSATTRSSPPTGRRPTASSESPARTCPARTRPPSSSTGTTPTPTSPTTTSTSRSSARS